MNSASMEDIPKMIKIRICICITLWTLFGLTAGAWSAQQKTFKTDAVSVRKALINGEIEEVLTYFESLAEDKEKAALATAHPYFWASFVLVGDGR